VEEQDEEQVIKRVDHSIPEMQHPAITPPRGLLDLVKPIDLDSAQPSGRSIEDDES